MDITPKPIAQKISTTNAEQSSCPLHNRHFNLTSYRQTIEKTRSSFILQLWKNFTLQHPLEQQFYSNHSLDHIALIGYGDSSKNTGLSIKAMQPIFEFLGYNHQPQWSGYLENRQNNFIWLKEDVVAECIQKDTRQDSHIQQQTSETKQNSFFKSSTHKFKIVLADFNWDALHKINPLITDILSSIEPPQFPSSSEIEERMLYLTKHFKDENEIVDKMSNYLIGFFNNTPSAKNIKLHEYQTLRQHNELLSWACIFKCCINHFGILLNDNFHNTSKHQITIEKAYEQLQNAGHVMNNKAGIQGCASIGIKQASIMGTQESIETADGKTIKVAGAFYEFVERFNKYDNFLPQNANNIIRSVLKN